jgi:rfaE bifunctional protein kinase chain/domain/rfaE bifunctional protein nucleotidyltransferase chain/domain
MPNHKIININELQKIVSKLKEKKKIIVHCHGVFDLLHYGHIKHFESAKKFGDILIVSLTADKDIHKGPSRPYFKNDYRLYSIAALEFVDYVVLNNLPTAINLIKIIKPNFYAKGPDYKNFSNDLTNKIKEEIKAVKINKGKFVTTNDVVYSSSNLINSNFSNTSSNHKNIITLLKKKYKSFLEIKNKIENLKNKKILIIGEAIIDEYIFVEAIGKSSKDPTLNYRYVRNEKYLGGSLAIAKNLSSFCKSIQVITHLGKEINYIDFIKSKLEKNIKLNLFNKNDSGTIIKKRIVENTDNIKVLGLYHFNDRLLDAKEENILIKKIKKNLKKFDIVIISDYNHGMLTEKVSSIISRNYKNLYNLNCQLNSSNAYFKSLSKFIYPKLIIINEGELRHQFKENNIDIKILIKKLLKENKAKNILVTRGKKGMLFYSKKEGFFNCDAFSETAVDKIGTGDTVLAFFSLLFNSNFDYKLCLLISSLAANYSIKMLANKDPIKKENIYQSLNHLLK